MFASETTLTQNSYYEASVSRPPPAQPLTESIQVDVCVVGAGLAGLSAAISLAERGYSVAILEARSIGWGASGRNGGQAIAGLACDIEVVRKQLGASAAKAVWGMTLEALDLIATRCQRYQIDCDWQSGFLSAAIGARKASALERSVAQMRADYGYEQTFISAKAVPDWITSNRYHALAFDPKSGHLHPLKYTLGLARAAASLGVQIFEHTTVAAVRPGRGAERTMIHTATDAVSAAHVLLAGNVYLDNLAPEIKSRIMPVGTYVMATPPLGEARARSLIDSRAAVCDTNFVLDYFRLSADHRLVFGGRVSYSTLSPNDLAGSMRRRMLGVFPQLNDVPAEYAWGGFVDITMNRAPDFGRLRNAPNVYYLQGFSGHGVALTGLAGQLVADAIAGDAERFDVFARLNHRPFPGGRLLRTPALVAAMAWYRLRDALLT